MNVSVCATVCMFASFCFRMSERTCMSSHVTVRDEKSSELRNPAETFPTHGTFTAATRMSKLIRVSCISEVRQRQAAGKVRRREWFLEKERVKKRRRKKEE